MAPEPAIVVALGAAALAGLVGVLLLARTWASLARGPGGDLTREVIYLRGPALVRPVACFVAAAALEIVKQLYWGLVLYELVPLSPDLRFAGSIAQAALLLTGGVMFYRRLRAFTPAARTSRRRQVLVSLEQTVQARGRTTRARKEE